MCGIFSPFIISSIVVTFSNSVKPSTIKLNNLLESALTFNRFLVIFSLLVSVLHTIKTIDYTNNGFIEDKFTDFGLFSDIDMSSFNYCNQTVKSEKNIVDQNPKLFMYAIWIVFACGLFHVSFVEWRYFSQWTHTNIYIIAFILKFPQDQDVGDIGSVTLL